MLKIDLLREMLEVSIALSAITCVFVQKTKKYLPCSNCLVIYSLIINMIIGILFCISFTSIKFPQSLWIGMFSFLGADSIYKALEGKVSSYTDLRDNTIKVPKDNLIRLDGDK